MNQHPMSFKYVLFSVWTNFLCRQKIVIEFYYFLLNKGMSFLESTESIVKHLEHRITVLESDFQGIIKQLEQRITVLESTDSRQLEQRINVLETNISYIMYPFETAIERATEN